MPLVVKDRVLETTSSTGTGTITLGGAVAGYQSFSVIGNGNTTYYTIVGGTEWEVGIGTYTSAGTTLSRDTVIESSNSNSLVNFSAGTKNVFVTYPAEKAIYGDANNNIFANNETLSLTSTATAAGTTTLTAASTYFQMFTGTTTQTVVLPVVSTLALGWTFHICNNSTGNLTVNSSGGNLVITVLPNTTAMVTCILVTGTTAASWEAGLTDLSAASSTQNGYLTSTDWNTFNNKGNGTVTSVSAGNGMSFTTITGSGSVTMGTPSNITNTSTNSVSAGTHTHALSGELVEATSGNPLYYGARAWVNFDGRAATPTIRGNVNVSSIGDNGVGDYTINFTTAMPDTNYAVCGLPSWAAGDSQARGKWMQVYIPTGYSTDVTTSSVRVRTSVESSGLGSVQDTLFDSVIVFR